MIIWGQKTTSYPLFFPTFVSVNLFLVYDGKHPSIPAITVPDNTRPENSRDSPTSVLDRPQILYFAPRIPTAGEARICVCIVTRGTPSPGKEAVGLQRAAYEAKEGRGPVLILLLYRYAYHHVLHKSFLIMPGFFNAFPPLLRA